MKQTTNYQLSQWDPGDRLLRTDFNGDNGKIDAAIKATETAAKDAVAAEATARGTAITTLTGKVTAAETAAAEGKAILLQEIVSQSAASIISVSLSGVNWNSWQEIWVDAWLTVGASDNFSVTIDLDGGDIGTSKATLSGDPFDNARGCTRIKLFVCQDGNRSLSSLCLSDYGNQFYSVLNNKFRWCHNINYRSQGTLQCGCRFKVWGVK